MLLPGYPSSSPRGCQVTTAQCTPTHHPSPSIHTGWVVASGNRTPNLTFNTSGSPADATSNMDVTPSLFKFLVKMPSNSSFVAKDIVRFK
ncbi:hypothetical protein DEO72_LG10g2828 [Vigna unguiculata]|uniref:Uncharacterized protein n=1 Tax=Vigna unguiculata TaxID=3917 RepID=A0A4D6NHH9_VIGUN|nr:hypothetical protein DEO72_LG10g2828 [Vigna unguiculata]